MPPVPRLSPPFTRRFWGLVHTQPVHFSHWYCSYFEIDFSNQIVQLPFGLILKWSDGTRLEEILAMQIVRAAGIPVPRVICYGEHPDSPHAPVSILMTRLPGKELGQIYESLSPAEVDTISAEMNAYLSSMRKWKNLWGEGKICSVAGTFVRSVRIPGHSAGPFDFEKDFNKHLLSPATPKSFDTDDEYQALRARADRLFEKEHDIVFTHGDLKHHNILVNDGHVAGFIDWESAGWYPEYWEFTTALRFTREDFW